MQPLLGIIIWPMSIQKQPCTTACKQKCPTQCMQISPDSTIRNAPHQPSPQPPATSHGTGTSHHPSHQPPAMAPAPQMCPRYYPQYTADSPTPSHRPSHQPGPHGTGTAKPRKPNPLLIKQSKNPTTQALFGELGLDVSLYLRIIFEPLLTPKLFMKGRNI